MISNETQTAEGEAPEGAENDDHGVGARVTAVFTAAEKAAQHIVILAREEADDIRRQARAEAETLLRERRHEAEREAQDALASARAEGDAILEGARAAARQIEDEARVRENRLREEARLTQERLEWAKEGLREVATRLDVVFPDQISPSEAEPPAGDDSSRAEV